MKKIIESVFLLFFSVFLFSCEPETYFFKNNTRNDEIVSIELISYSSNDVSVVESTGEMLDFNAENMEILEILDETKKEDFISEFSQMEFFQGYPHLNSPKGIGVKINYENGDFLIVTDGHAHEDGNGGDAILYNSDGEFLEFFGSLSWIPSLVDLVNGNFETQID